MFVFRKFLSILSLVFFLSLAMQSCMDQSREALPAQQLKIVGGKALQSTPPWVAQLYDSGAGIYCGGSQIADDVIITAAHCVHPAYGIEPQGVYLGLNKLSDRQEIKPRGVREIVIHEDLINDDVELANDFALIFLSRMEGIEDKGPSSGGDFIALNRDEAFPESLKDKIKLKAIGMGDQDVNGVTHDGRMHEVELPLVPLADCQSKDQYELVRSSQICAGYPEGGHDTCAGDSGSPLVANLGSEEEPSFVLVGITSWGIGCAEPGQPGVYSRVSSFTPWIESEIRKQRLKPVLENLF